MAEQMVETRVGRLKVTVIGDRGPTALLWHSLFVDERSWNGMLPRLADRRRLVVVTGPGHGASTDPGRRYTLRECAEAAAAGAGCARRQRAGRLGGQRLGRACRAALRSGLAGAVPKRGCVRHAGRRTEPAARREGPGSCWVCIGCWAHRRRSWTERPRCCCRRARSSATRMPSPSSTTASVAPIGACCGTRSCRSRSAARTSQSSSSASGSRCSSSRAPTITDSLPIRRGRPSGCSRGTTRDPPRHRLPRAARGAGGIRRSRARAVGRRGSGSDAVRWFYEVIYQGERPSRATRHPARLALAVGDCGNRDRLRDAVSRRSQRTRSAMVSSAVA